MKVYIYLTIAIVSMKLVSCSKIDSCLDLGDNLFQNMENLSTLASQNEFPLEKKESAFIVGAAKAMSQVEQSPIKVCLRLNSSGATEFRTLTTSGAIVQQWVEVSEVAKPPNA